MCVGGGGGGVMPHVKLKRYCHMSLMSLGTSRTLSHCTYVEFMKFPMFKSHVDFKKYICCSVGFKAQ